MAWTFLLIAAALEVGWALGLKYTDGFTKLGPSIATGSAMVCSMYLLSLAARTIPIGTAYAIWTGLGAAGTALLGMVVFSEPRDALRLGCIGLILLGAAGLKFSQTL